MFLAFMGLYAPFFYVQTYAIETGLANPNLAFYLLSIINAASIFGRIIPGFVGDMIGPMNMIIPCALLAGVLSLCLIDRDDIGSVIAICVVRVSIDALKPALTSDPSSVLRSILGCSRLLTADHLCSPDQEPCRHRHSNGHGLCDHLDRIACRFVSSPCSCSDSSLRGANAAPFRHAHLRRYSERKQFHICLDFRGRFDLAGHFLDHGLQSHEGWIRYYEEGLKVFFWTFTLPVITLQSDNCCPSVHSVVFGTGMPTPSIQGCIY